MATQLKQFNNYINPYVLPFFCQLLLWLTIITSHFKNKNLIYYSINNFSQPIDKTVLFQIEQNPNFGTNVLNWAISNSNIWHSDQLLATSSLYRCHRRWRWDRPQCRLFCWACMYTLFVQRVLPCHYWKSNWQQPKSRHIRFLSAVMSLLNDLLILGNLPRVL